MKTKLPDGCALCNREYVRGHVCKEAPYTITKLIALANSRKTSSTRKGNKK